MENKRSIIEFWNWFSRYGSERLVSVEDGTEPIVQELDRRLDSLNLRWELGPGESDGHMLAISFDADPEKLQLAQLAVDLAPKLEGWTIVLGKPPRAWNGKFFLTSSSGREVVFDASGWICAVERSERGIVIRVCMDPMTPEQDELAEWAAEIAVQETIGELNFAKNVDELVISTPSEVNRSQGAKFLLPQLRIS